MKRICISLYFIALSLAVLAQTDSLKLVKYSSGFRFREGLYLNHDQMIENSPVRKSQIISKYNKNNSDYFTKLMAQETVLYFDKYGLRKEVDVSELWGFSRRGSVFINWGEDFNRIPVMGAICHFVATITVYDEKVNMPVGSFSYYDIPTRTARSEINQYLMEFESGKVINYNVANVEMLLMRCPELYDEFVDFKKKKKKQMKFLYLRKLNEKYPIYIPIN